MAYVDDMPRIRKLVPTSIYWLIDMRPEILREWSNGQPFYCGKTIFKVETRFRNHCNTALRYPNRLISRRLKECGVHVRIQIMEVVSPDGDWAAREQFWIRMIRGVNPEAVNKAAGGQGPAGNIHPPEVRAKMSASRTGKKRAPFSEEHRANLSTAARNRTIEIRTKVGDRYRGKKLSAEHRANVSAGMRGKKRGPYSAEHRTKISEAKRRAYLVKSSN